jgi:hypothetical protein
VIFGKRACFWRENMGLPLESRTEQVLRVFKKAKVLLFFGIF